MEHFIQSGEHSPKERKNLVIFAGAGISKDKPSDLPSWWEYNRYIIDEIGKIGAQAIGETDSLLDSVTVLEKIPIVTISDYLFNYSAGKAYFPLLEILNGIHPNRNHYLLASLAQEGKIQAVITTNFDTLIEQAFDETGVPYTVYSNENDFYITETDGRFPIYKIHGSVIDTQSAIDTASQKLRGLSAGKYQLLCRVFHANHIIFMGFSGDDFSFGQDYLPLKEACCGITWIINPDRESCMDKMNWIEDPENCSKLSGHVRRIIPGVQGFRLCIATITAFCEYMEWRMPKVKQQTNADRDAGEGTEKTAAIEKMIREFLCGPHVTKWSCLGMCIEFFRFMQENETALELNNRADQRMTEQFCSYRNEEGDFLDLPIFRKHVSDLLPEEFPAGLEQVPGIEYFMPLFDTMGDTYAKAGFFQKAMKYFHLSLRITNFRFCCHLLCPETEEEKLQIARNNMATTKMRIGMMLSDMERYQDAAAFYTEAFEDAVTAKRYYNLSAAYLCRTTMELFFAVKKGTMQQQEESHRSELDIDRFYADLWCAIRLAKKGGYSHVLCRAYYIMTLFFWYIGRYSEMLLALDLFSEYARITVAPQPYEETAAQLRTEVPAGTVKADELPKEILYKEPHYADIWEECCDRDVLSTAEGKQAYIQFKEGNIEGAMRIFADASDRYYLCQNSEGERTKEENLCKAEMFSFCYIRMKLLSGQSFICEETEKYMKRCLELELRLWQTDYFVVSSSWLAQYYYSVLQYDNALFYAEFCMCLCDNPVFHGIILGSCAVASECCTELGRISDAKRYAGLYLDWARQMPEAADEELVEHFRSK